MEIAGVADGDVAVKLGQSAFVKDLRDQAHFFIPFDLLTVGNHDSGGFLAPVLEREEAEIGQTGDIFPRRIDAEDAALLAGRVIVQAPGRRVGWCFCVEHTAGIIPHAG